jgi:glycosyltransferase involved in cell wall biosynthesis
MSSAPPLISLVIATSGTRPMELRRMLDSVRTQTEQDCEVIVVDQGGGALDALLREYPEVVHVRSSQRGLSRNRNIGIAHCTGRIVAFPDDDCVLPPNYLAEVKRFAPQLHGATLFAFGDGLQLEDRQPFHPLYRVGSIRRVTVLNCYKISSMMLFFAREVFDRVGGFDEDFGVGATYGAAEEVDLMLRLIEAGIAGVYAPGVEILHPARRSADVSRARHDSYSEGLGAMVRKHWQHSRNWRLLLFFAYSLLRSIGGVPIGVLRRNGMAGISAGNLAAKLRGFVRYRPTTPQAARASAAPGTAVSAPPNT